MFVRNIRKIALVALLAGVFVAPGVLTAQIIIEDLVLVCYKVKKDEGTQKSETLEVADDIRGERFVTLKARKKAQQVCVFGVADQIPGTE